MWFQPIDKQILFTKNDKEDPRLGECVQILPAFDSSETLKAELKGIPLKSSDICLLGYADDDGISANGGRIGAAKAPQSIRTSLFKMTPHLRSRALPHILDLGDINLGVNLGERHERARQTVAEVLRGGPRFLALGGGHDYGYADAGGFLDVFTNDAVVINFDAHLDVRPVHKEFHSGTPFFRILSEFEKKVHFIEVGLQNQCNSQAHWKWAAARGAVLLAMDDLGPSMATALQTALKGHEGKKIFLSVDIDGFRSSHAPGCSQSWATGFSSQDFFTALDSILNNFDVRGLGIYEVSPPLDFDNQTSKLAALIAHRYISHGLTE